MPRKILPATDRDFSAHIQAARSIRVALKVSWSLSRHRDRFSHDFMFMSLSNIPPFLPHEGKISRFVPFNFVHGSSLDRRT